MRQKFTKRDKILTHDFYKTYRDNKKIPKKYKIKDFREATNVVKVIFKVAAKNLIEREGGVLLDRFGYLCHWMTPKNCIFKHPIKGGKFSKLMINSHADRKWYNTALFTDVIPNSRFTGWFMDRSFNHEIKKGRYKQLQRGMKYKFYYTLIKNLNINKDIY